MSYLPVQLAIDWLHDSANSEFGLVSLDGKGRQRTKVQLFALPKCDGRQFAIHVGESDKENSGFSHPDCRVYLEVEVPSDIPGIRPLPGHINNGQRLARQQDSRLKPGHQYAAFVDSLSALKQLLRWYSQAPLHTSAQVSQDQPMSKSNVALEISAASPTNTILYGPPGTGKTYATTARAVNLCDGQLPGNESFAEIFSRYEELRHAGRISFVTFHQAFGYEEFVEGIRPVTEGGQISYRVKSGVFKSACDRARVQHSIRPGLGGKPLKERTILKMSLGKSWSDEGRIVFNHCIQNECVLLGWGEDIDFSGCDSRASVQQTIEAQRPQIDRKDSVLSFVNLFKNEIKLGDLIVVTNGNKWVRAVAEVVGDYEFVEDAPFQQMRKVRWLGVFEPNKPSAELYEKEVGMSSLYRLNPNHIRFDVLEAWLNDAAEQPQDEAHVLIIDEINRANISKVFGELITLIEPDKREGQAQPITVKLPYSGDDFCVPGNLHIIGTMNTADRSIALLDTALRRRFDFEEVMPEPEVLASISIEGVDMVQMLTAINQRIEVLYDRDHTIGHAYFVKVGSLEDLDHTFRKKVIPLLQEYFHENWQKIRQVLGDTGEGNFIVRQVAPILPLDEEDPFALEAKSVYRLNPRPFSVQAFQRIYQGA
jgi:5-methylcytosine-specific restriction protein B